LSVSETFVMSDYPGFLPGMVIAVVLGAVVRRPVGRFLAMSDVEAWVLVVSIGAVLSATLTPGAEGPRSVMTTLECDTSRMGPAPLSTYLTFGTTSLNVLLFVPLGWAITRIGRPAPRAAALVIAVLLPIAIEVIQLVATPLGRACQVADVVDNLVGLALGIGAGLAIGFALAFLGRKVVTTPEPPPPPTG
jgi:VanZ family protein